MLKRLRLRLAVWLDGRHPDWCWANLCCDLALGYDLWHWRANAKDVTACEIDLEKLGCCWCGKKCKEPVNV